MKNLIYYAEKTSKTTSLMDITTKKVAMCTCSGKEKIHFIDEDKIPSYSGNFKSPIGVMWFYPSTDIGITVDDSLVRKWVKDASLYQGIPHILLALILQNENAENSPYWRKIGQFIERTLTTVANIIDEKIFIIPNVISKGSSGLANMSDKALKLGVQHSIEKYARPPIPTSISKTILGINTDSQISGDDWRNDLYYAAAHIRYLIDKNYGDCYSGEMTIDMLHTILRAYNGPG
ncbi:hypothetical protein ACLSZ3_10735, partial [Avibacterium gallinarum]